MTPTQDSTTSGPERLASRGDWAVWQGVAYPCSDRAAHWPLLALGARANGRAPSGLQPYHEHPERPPLHLVAPERVDAWFEACWTFRWRGEPFQSEGTTVRGDGVRGRYLGEDQAFAERHLRRIVSWEGVLPLDEIGDVVEHRTDLRAQREERVRLLAETDGYRPRVLARVGGQEFPAAAEADESGRVAVGDPDAGEQRLVPVAELEAWWGVHWTFVMPDESTGVGNHPFAALGPERDTIKGRYIGDQTYGLVMHTYLLTEERRSDGSRMYVGNAYPDRITEITEHHVDLLEP